MKLFFYWSFISSGLFAAIYCGAESLFAGSACKNGNATGTCELKPDCPESEKAVDEYGYHNLTRCGFDKFTEIVCCPASSTRIRAPSIYGEKSKRACNKYTENVLTNVFTQIAGGRNASEGEFPCMAALGMYSAPENLYKFNCGGTLISEKYVLTAAHCILNVEKDVIKFVRMGTIDVPASTETINSATDFNVKNFTIHPNYVRIKNWNDIALLELEIPMEFNDKLRPACLYAVTDKYPDEYYITGWGFTDNNGSRNNILQKAVVRFVSFEHCAQRYKTSQSTELGNTSLCAVDLISDTCQGDSGGPLLQKDATVPILVGITSFGVQGCGSKFPSVYISVSEHLKWIEDIVWP